MPELEGWFETENGLEQFLIEASSLEAAVLEMIDYDQDFGHTDMEMTWDGKDVPSKFTPWLPQYAWSGRTHDAQSRSNGDYVKRYL